MSGVDGRRKRVARQSGPLANSIRKRYSKSWTIPSSACICGNLATATLLSTWSRAKPSKRKKKTGHGHVIGVDFHAHFRKKVSRNIDHEDFVSPAHNDLSDRRCDTFASKSRFRFRCAGTCFHPLDGITRRFRGLLGILPARWKWNRDTGFHPNALPGKVSATHHRRLFDLGKEASHFRMVPWGRAHRGFSECLVFQKFQTNTRQALSCNVIQFR